MNNRVKYLIRSCAWGLFQSVVRWGHDRPVLIVCQEQDREELRRREAFFLGVDRAIYADWIPAASFASRQTIGYCGMGSSVRKLRPGLFNLDWRTNPYDGWAWIDLANYKARYVVATDVARDRYRRLFSRLLQLHLSKCYVFGTGPSLEKALDRDWQDGIRIVCNTIARGRDLWHHIDPHIVVAGDGIYHFGFTDFAKTFRRDLLERLKESGTYFAYPAMFDLIVRREMGEVADRLLPIPMENGGGLDLLANGRFALPGLGNVLSCLLLPLAIALSRDVNLWGFDGRAPKDTGFWANARLYSYPELLPTLQAAHPAFFSHHVPAADPNKYVHDVHGVALDAELVRLERRGWKFVMMHNSYTPVLARRMISSHD